MKRRIWWDCSYLYSHPEINTGIERVVRLLGEAIVRACAEPDVDFTFHPCISLDNGSVLELTAIPPHGQTVPESHGEPVELVPPDIFIVADSTWDKNILSTKAASWRAGVTTGVIQYDMVPITHPHTTTEQMVEAFRDWVNECATFADFFACISQTSADDTLRVLQQEYPWRAAPKGSIFTFPLSSFPSSSSLTRSDVQREKNRFLAVGTIEPRKRYDLILDAFSQLWEADFQGHLVIVGKAGWKTDSLVLRIRELQEQGVPLTWLDRANDDQLHEEYLRATSLIAASEHEGFGLPILEAISRGTPVLASDIPIFREVAGSRASYFVAGDATALAESLRNIHESASAMPGPADSTQLPTWDQSARIFIDSLRTFALPNHNLRKLYDRRVGSLITESSPSRLAYSPNPSSGHPTSYADTLLRARASLLALSKRRLAGYPLRLTNALLHSSSTRWHLFNVEKALDEYQAELSDLKSEIRFLETRLTSLIALEHEHSRAIVESIIASMEEDSRDTSR